MNRTQGTTQENGEMKSSFQQQLDSGVGYTYEGSYAMYSSNTSAPSSVNQPLPGQPPLPPMPPPPGALPPLPHVFGPVGSQVASIQTWAHPPPPPWQWITPQASALQSQTQRDMANNAYQRSAVARGNFARRDRFNQNRNNVYAPRGAFHRNKNRRPQQRYDQQTHQQGQFESASYFGQALNGAIGLEWQRTNMAAVQNEAIINRTTASIPAHQITASSPRISAARTDDETTDQGIKIISEVSLKKSKQRKPMSQNYPSRPWNRVDAENALQIENEYNKTIRAQSLIIKFPDPDLNKDIVREFHPGIQNIHFQSPSGPRYCFIQMAENVDIDKAIRELEKIPFGVGTLKVERKSLRDEDNPMPEEIDPYTLYVGNLPESVNVNEVKNKFPTAARVDVGYAQKMRNTRYAFIRYTNVEESIAAYKQAHDLMWDTRSIIVRFRRQRGNTCLPGEPKNNSKKSKEEPVTNEQGQKEQNANSTDSTKGRPMSRSSTVSEEYEKDSGKDGQVVLQSPTTIETETKNLQPIAKNIRRLAMDEIAESVEVATTPVIGTESAVSEAVMITDIKEEPEDYDDMEMSYMEDDDDDDDPDDDDDDEDEDEDNLVREEDIDDVENDHVEDDVDDEEEDMLNEDSLSRRREKDLTDSEPPDELDPIFGELENSIPRDIEL